MLSLLVLSTLAVSVAAQQGNYTLPAGFNIGAVDESERASWCNAQLNTCPEICPGGIGYTNTCDPDTLNFACSCNTNGTPQDVSSYTGTIPYFVCQANFGQCIQAHPNDLDGQTECKKNAQCGTKNATSSDASSTTTAESTSSPTSSSSSSGGDDSSSSASASGSAASATSTHKSAGTALRMAQDYSSGLFAAALLLAVRVAL